MDTKSNSKIQDEHVHVDPQLLFQKLVMIGMKNDKLRNVFDYELCHYYPALFESVSAIRPTAKSIMAEMLCDVLTLQNFPGPSETVT